MSGPFLSTRATSDDEGSRSRELDTHQGVSQSAPSRQRIGPRAAVEHVHDWHKFLDIPHRDRQAIGEARHRHMSALACFAFRRLLVNEVLWPHFRLDDEM